MTQRPLLLIPGLNCTAALWRDQVAALGAGRTVSVADHGRGSDLGTIAEAILAEAPQGQQWVDRINAAKRQG